MAQVYALLADGTTVEIRPAGPGDFDAVKAMHQAMSPDNTYMRFFNISRLVAEIEARRICKDPVPGQVALLALVGDEVVGVASYVSEVQGQAEVAFAVADQMHNRGVATLLLEHLVSFARSHQITIFTAETLTENKAMLNVFADAGLPVERHYVDGIFELTFPLPSEDTGPTLDSYLSAVAEREGRAEVASLRHVLAPESVAVIGASRRQGTVGRAILDNIRVGGYGGRLYVVNPRARQIGGERCLSSVLDLPEAVDLAVIAVPAPGVLDVAEQCGQRGVRSLVVITAWLDTEARADLLAVCRRHGMRLVGPDCFGVAVPGIGLDATFAARPAKPGVTGLVMQSGGLGLAMVDHLSRLGIGISSFASVGDKLDVSSNDMLMWWEHDGLTKLAVLYIESFGNPRKFARTARRVSRTMPVLTVLPDRSDLREALFEQAGVITTRGFGELIQATALLASQPVPAGRTVAIVSNVGSAGVLAADACTDLGLSVIGPVDVTAPVSADDFRQCLELLAADEDVHAIVAIVLPTGATGDLEAAIAAAASHEVMSDVPLVAVVLTQPESVRMLPGQVPAYGSPEAAVRALARAVGYGAWRAEPPGHVPAFADIRTEAARTLVRRSSPGWLAPEQTAELLRCYRIPLANLLPAGTEVTVRVTDDRMFGSLVTLGPRTARLTPLTDQDADKLISAGRGGDPPRPPRSFSRGDPSPRTPLGRDPSPQTPLGGDSIPPDPHGPLRDLLLRVSRLAEDLPEVTELDLDPVIVSPEGVTVVNARIKVTPYEPRDPFLRKLR
jgi:acyl-CoA synthetase (NDP forming)/GNAT superfamily N-acetyltransferase